MTADHSAQSAVTHQAVAGKAELVSIKGVYPPVSFIPHEYNPWRCTYYIIVYLHDPTASTSLLHENVCQVTWSMGVEGGQLRLRAEFWAFDDLFEHVAERLAHANGSFGRRLDEQTFVLSSDGCAFLCRDLSQVGL